MKDWDQSALYMFEAIKRIEKKLESLDANLREHMASEEQRLVKIENDLARAQSDIRWHSKLAAGLGTLGGLVVSWLLTMVKHN